MARNTLTDLNDHLFMAMERLGDEDLKGDELNQEVTRAKAMSAIAHQIIDNASLMLDAIKFNDNKLDESIELPKMLN